MKSMLRFLLGVVFFPVDLFRLMMDSWRMTMEGFPHRFYYQTGEQPCIFCRDMDLSVVPRVMSWRIRYWNLWMVRLLLPDLQVKANPKGLRNLPVCPNESAYVPTLTRVPLIAGITTSIWLGFLIWLLCLLEWIPAEQQAQFMEWARGLSATRP